MLTGEPESIVTGNDLDPQPGEQYVCIDPFTGPSWEFEAGDKFTVLAKTNEAPYGYRNVKGNWIIDGPNGITVWAKFDMALHLEWIEKVS